MQEESVLSNLNLQEIVDPHPHLSNHHYDQDVVRL